ncbi:hypothetical protein HK098_000833 [Nowakowskiella sp. JEL0407]|nr:hypothetical protein HK098_000833 [Nowakowskiella sp. JEL0407]
MENIERDKLYTDLGYRFGYVSKFVGFGEHDIKLIHDSASHLAPLVPTVVDAVYKKLFTFDITKSVFANKMEKFHGGVIESEKLLELTRYMTVVNYFWAPDQDIYLAFHSDQIKFRKDMLSKYLVKLVSAEYNEDFIKYLDRVALIHLRNEAKTSKINVEYIHINALMGYVENILIEAIFDLPLETQVKKDTVLAFNKLLWIQNDMFAQYYVRDGNELPESRTILKHVDIRPPCAHSN